MSGKLTMNSNANTKNEFMDEKNNEIFNRSETHIKNIIPSFKKGTSIEKQVLPYLEKVISSKNEPIPLKRTLDELKIDTTLSYSELSASDKIREMSLFNCHDGQRKLTLGYLEFIAKSIKDLKCSPKDVFIVYAGSSGLACAIALSVFPDLMMAAYDPNPNIVNYLPRLVRNKTSFYKNRADVPESQIKWQPLMIFTDKAGWFNDKVAMYCKNVLFPLSGRKHLLFVSDVRAETKEIDIVTDMKNQMRWTIMLKCDYYMHKFRLPYFDTTNQNVIKGMYNDLRHIYPYVSSQPHIKNKNESNNPSSILYLDGQMFIQPFGPQRTTEFRLIGKPDVKSHFHSYVLNYYDVTRIENQSSLFNNIFRGYASFTISSNMRHIKTYISSYEKVAEYYILMSCIITGYSVFNEKNGKSNGNMMRELYNMVNTIMLEIVKIKPNMDACKYVSMMKTLRKDKKKYHSTVPPYFDEIFKNV